MYFEQKVNRRSRKAMVDFLTSHFRYSTMSSWNNVSSYAHKVKVHSLGLTGAQINKAYEVLDVDFWDEIDYPIHDFTQRQKGHYTISSNGRSGGYLVLMNSEYKKTGHKSYCPCCGQRNFKRVFSYDMDHKKFALGKTIAEAELTIFTEVISNGGIWRPEVYLEQSAIKAMTISDENKLKLVVKAIPEAKDTTVGNRCGRCGKDSRVNFMVEPSTLNVFGKAIDQGEEFDPEEWTMENLRDRVDLVCDFDRTVDELRSIFIGLTETYCVKEEVIMVPKTVKTLVECNL